MKLKFTSQYQYTPIILMRKCGYMQIASRKTGQVSYARRFGVGHYPRFHVYIDPLDDGFQVNLHLDQKEPSYGSHTAHNGEYDGEVVEREGDRVRQIIESVRI